MVPASCSTMSGTTGMPRGKQKGVLIICWGRSADGAKRGGAKYSGLQEGRPLPVEWGQRRRQGGGGSSAVPCGGWNSLCKSLEAGILGLQWRPWLQIRDMRSREREHWEGRNAAGHKCWTLQVSEQQGPQLSKCGEGGRGNGNNDQLPMCQTLYSELYRHLMQFSPQPSVGAIIIPIV